MTDNFGNGDIQILPLRETDSVHLSEILCSVGGEYSKYFTPFAFDSATITGILHKASMDRFWGIFLSGTLAGFYMLRGWDDGYDIPSYGVWIAPQYSGIGLVGLTLHHAFVYCRLRGVKKIMLKVHPENISAKKIYEASGFHHHDIDSKSGNIIYYKTL